MVNLRRLEAALVEHNESDGTYVARCALAGGTPRPPSFFFQAEDGIRDLIVTGVQTCALPISNNPDSPACGLSAHTASRGCAIPHQSRSAVSVMRPMRTTRSVVTRPGTSRSGTCEIGRASCRERV